MKASATKAEPTFGCDDLPVPTVLYQKRTGKIIKLNKAARKVFQIPTMARASSIWRFRAKEVIPVSASKSSKILLVTNAPHKTLKGNQILLNVRSKSVSCNGEDCQLEVYETVAKNARGVSKVKSSKKDIKENSISVKQNIDQLIQDMLVSVTDGFFATDRNLNFILVNPSFAQQAKLSPEDMVGKNMVEMYPYMKGGKLLQTYREALRTGKPQKFFHVNSLNAEQEFEINVYPNPHGLFVYYKDISAWRQAQSKLLEAKAIFDKVSAHVPGMIYQYRLRLDGTSHFPYTSSGILDIYGVFPEDVAENAALVFDVIHPDDRSRIRESIQKSADTLSRWHEEYRINHPSGKLIWVEGNSSPQVNADGSISWYGYITEVTNRREALQRLQESEERFKLLYNRTPAMMHSINGEGKLIRVSDYWLQKMGYTREEVIGRRSTDFLAPESRKLAMEKYLPDFLATGESSNIEYQFVTKSGQVLDTLLSAVKKGTRQQDAESIAVITDITDKKNLEREISKLALTASRTSNAVIFTDVEGRITWVNDGFQKITEYSFDEVIGKKPGHFLQGPDTNKEAVQQLRDNLQKGQTIRTELLNYSKSGRTYWLDIEVIPIRDAQERLTGFMAIESDITQLKNLINDIRNTEARLQTMMDYAPISVFMKDLQGNYTFLNHNLKNSLGKLGFKEGAQDRVMLPEELAGITRNRDHQVTEHKQAITYEAEFRGRHYLATKFPILDVSGSLYAIGGIAIDVTEQNALAKQVKAKEERLLNLATNIPGGVICQYRTDSNGNFKEFLFLSNSCEAIYGISSSELMRDPTIMFSMMSRSDIEKITQFTEVSCSNLRSFEMETRIVNRRGEIKWMHTRSIPKRDDDSILWDGISIDVTDRKLAEQEMITTSWLYHLTSTINQMVVRAKSVNEIYTEACKIATTIGKFRMAWIGIVDHLDNEVKPIISDGYVENYFDVIPKISTLDVPNGRGPSGRAVREKCTIINNDISSLENVNFSQWREHALLREYRSSIALPIMVDGNVISIFTLYHAEPHFFKRNEIQLLEELTSNIAYGIASTENQKKRLEKELALKDSEELFRKLVNDINIGILLQSSKAEMLLCNQSALQLLGLSEPQLLGLTSFDSRWNVIHEDGTNFPSDTHPVPTAIRTRQALRNVIMGVFRPEKGDRIWLSVDAVPRVDSAGNVRDVICTFHDVTEKRNALMLLRHQAEEIQNWNEQFMSIAQNLPNGSICQFIMSADGSISMPFFSDGLAARLGFSGQDIMNDFNAFADRCHPEDKEKFQHALRESAQQLTDLRERQVRFRDNKGIYHHLAWYARPTLNGKGSIIWQGIVMDETDQRQAERNLQLARFTIDHTGDPIYWIRPNGTFYDMNPAAYQSLGYTFDELLKMSVPDIDPYYTSDVWPKHWQELREKGVLHFSTQQKRKDGTLFDVEIDANYIVFEGQEYNCAFVRDVTEKRKMELLLMEKEMQVSTLANNIPNGAIYQFQYLPSNDYQYNFFSQGVESITGLAVETILNNPDSIMSLIHADDMEELTRKVEESRARMAPLSHEFRQGTVHGDYKWVRINSNPHQRNDGTLVWDGVFLDITDRKKSEQALLESNVEKDLLIKEIHHRVKNNLQLISSMIYVKMIGLQEGSFRDFLGNIRQKIRSIALIHERLLQTGSVNTVNVADYIGKLIGDLQMASQRGDINIQLVSEIATMEMNLDQAIYCGLIINELVTNAVKHAFIGRRDGVINVQLSHQDNEIQLIVSDNGTSLSQPSIMPTPTTATFGMQMIDMLVKQLRASIRLETEKGTTYKIAFQKF